MFCIISEEIKYESFYNQLDHSIWNDFEEKLRYRISRA